MDKNDASVINAYERVKQIAQGRIVEPLQDHTLAWSNESLSCWSTEGFNDIGTNNMKGENNIIFRGRDTTSTIGFNGRGQRNIVYIGPFCTIGLTAINISGDDNIVFIGAHTDIVGGGGITVQGNNCRIFVGERTKIGAQVILTNTDGHPVFDMDHGHRINHNKDVYIGDHALLEDYVGITKGGIVEHDGIVLTGSMITKPVKSFCVYDGNPAEIIQENIQWSKFSAIGNLEEARILEDQLMKERLKKLNTGSSVR